MFILWNLDLFFRCENPESYFQTPPCHGHLIGQGKRLHSCAAGSNVTFFFVTSVRRAVGKNTYNPSGLGPNLGFVLFLYNSWCWINESFIYFLYIFGMVLAKRSVNVYTVCCLYTLGLKGATKRLLLSPFRNPEVCSWGSLSQHHPNLPKLCVAKKTMQVSDQNKVGLPNYD